MRAFDFDVGTAGWAQSLFPGNEQRNYWGSAAADLRGSRNLAGIKDIHEGGARPQSETAQERDALRSCFHAGARALSSGVLTGG